MGEGELHRRAQHLSSLNPKGPTSYERRKRWVHTLHVLNRSRVKEGSKIIVEPYTYLSSKPGKDIRQKVLSACNVWLKVDAAPLETIVHVMSMLHNASLLWVFLGRWHRFTDTPFQCRRHRRWFTNPSWVTCCPYYLWHCANNQQCQLCLLSSPTAAHNTQGLASRIANFQWGNPEPSPRPRDGLVLEGYVDHTQRRGVSWYGLQQDWRAFPSRNQIDDVMQHAKPWPTAIYQPPGFAISDSRRLS